jgi:hypothetical protein
VDLAKRLSAAGAKVFAESLAMDKVAPRYLDLLKKLTGKTI